DMPARDFPADGGQLLQGGTGRQTAAGIAARPVITLESFALMGDELTEIGDMQEIANLFPLAAIADVIQRAAEVMRGGPERNHTLIGLTHLPRAGNYAAAIDDMPEAVSVRIFLHHQLRCQLRHPIEGACAGQREGFADAVFRSAGYMLLRNQREACGILAEA